MFLKGAQKLPPGMGHSLYEEKVNLYIAQGTTAKAQGTMALAVNVVGYFEVILRPEKYVIFSFLKTSS